MNINDLFCTPEQGRRLKEIVPNLQYAMAWAVVWEDWDYMHTDIVKYTDTMRERNTIHSPALTLQELRDVARERLLLGLDELSQWVYSGLIRLNTATELADWVIVRLEETKQ